MGWAHAARYRDHVGPGFNYKLKSPKLPHSNSESQLRIEIRKRKLGITYKYEPLARDRNPNKKKGSSMERREELRASHRSKRQRPKPRDPAKDRKIIALQANFSTHSCTSLEKRNNNTNIKGYTIQREIMESQLCKSFREKGVRKKSKKRRKTVQKSKREKKEQDKRKRTKKRDRKEERSPKT